MAIDTIKSTAVLDGAIATADIADDAVTSAKLDTNIAVAGTFGVTGATTLNGNIVLDNEDTTLSGGEVLGKIEFKDNDGGSSAAGITSKMESLAIGDFGASALTFHTSTSGGGGRTALTERFRIQHNGGVTFNGDTADANALDDYEEGTFTPTFHQGFASPTYSIQVGRYTKIGRTVHFNLHIDINTVGAASSAQWKLGGLPFTSLNISNVFGGAYSVYTGGVHDHNHDNQVYWAVGPGQTTVLAYKASGSVYPGTSVSAPTGGFDIVGQYRTAS